MFRFCVHFHVQALPTEVQRLPAVPPRAALPPLSLRLPGLHDLLQVVGVRRAGLQPGPQHPHPLHQHVCDAGEGHRSSLPGTGQHY